MILLDDRAGQDVVETNRENLDPHRFNMIGDEKVLREPCHLFRVCFQVPDGSLRGDMKRGDGFDNHQAMKRFGHDQRGCTGGEPTVLDALEQLSTGCGVRVGPEKW